MLVYSGLHVVFGPREQPSTAMVAMDVFTLQIYNIKEALSSILISFC